MTVNQLLFAHRIIFYEISEYFLPVDFLAANQYVIDSGIS